MSDAVAKLQWQDPNTKKICEYVLTEGATVIIGRSSNNDIQIAEQHVSRQHTVIQYREGVFMISDLGSSNGTFVNNNPISDDESFPLFAGDEIRLYVPTLRFLAVTEGDEEKAKESGFFITATNPSGQGSLIVTNGPQEGQTIPLLLNQVTVGRATNNATWEVLIQDPSVSRPHARFEKRGDRWYIVDLGSANGTRVNHNEIDHTGYGLADGDTLELGRSLLLFRTGWQAPEERGRNGQGQ
ncbi:MAG: FHA domain-containing protein [Anaerolineae bacterium]|nr:FHA domain-containing protein [Anaerolineae bacterium]